MKKYFFFFAFLLCSSSLSALSALDELRFEYAGALDSWIDNTEFGGCPYQNDQTMASARPLAEVGFSANEATTDGWKHQLMIGGTAILNWGDEGKFDRFAPIAYYRVHHDGVKVGNAVLFEMGAFKRSDLRAFPRLFFQDSIYFYRPTVEGCMIDLSRANAKGSSDVFRDTYLTAWLDWTGHQSATRRESFFAAWSGRYAWGGVYMAHYGYLLHFAKRKDHPEDGIRSNLLTQTSLGYDFAVHMAGMKELSLEVGYVQAAEENRLADRWVARAGLSAMANAHWWRLRFSNTLYLGKGQMLSYEDFSNDLYWGDPVYRATFYDRVDAGFDFFDTKRVKLKMDLSLHVFKGGDVYPEQRLVSSFYF